MILRLLLSLTFLQRTQASYMGRDGADPVDMCRQSQEACQSELQHSCRRWASTAESPYETPEGRHCLALIFHLRDPQRRESARTFLEETRFATRFQEEFDRSDPPRREIGEYCRREAEGCAALTVQICGKYARSQLTGSIEKRERCFVWIESLQGEFRERTAAEVASKGGIPTALQSIQKDITDLTTMVETIRTATAEERDAVQEIRAQVKDEELHAERNASAAVELSASANQVASTATELARVAEELSATVRHFSI